MNILLIDDDMSLRRTLRITLEALGHRVTEAGDSARAQERLAHAGFDLAMLDLRLGREQGLELLPVLLRLAPGLDVVVMTAYATIETAVEAMRRGAADYLPKPFTPDQLRLVLERTTRLRRLESHVAALEEQVRSQVQVAFKAAPSEASILIRGESGTGKGVLAWAIHARSLRASAPFVTVSCPSLSGELLESELFGHVQGAFTGAVRDTVGKVAVAEGGTLFLDEIGDLPVALQPKLLRLLQEKRYERIGETQTRVGDVRILAATNRDLSAAVAAGTFREDLLYRLNVIEVTLPPLRERRRDVLPLAEHLLRFFARKGGSRVTGFTNEAREALGRYPWPGNVRELRNAIERGVILCSETVVGLADLPTPIGSPAPSRRVEVGGAVTGGRAHPPYSGAGVVARRGGDHPGHQPQHALPQAATLWSVMPPAPACGADPPLHLARLIGRIAITRRAMLRRRWTQVFRASALALRLPILVRLLHLSRQRHSSTFTWRMCFAQQERSVCLGRRYLCKPTICFL
jgi:NtrC-family two-component system response regulator AlgB